MKAPGETTEMEVRTGAEREHVAQLRSLSRALQEVHRGLLEVSRQRYELANGRVQSEVELLQLVLHDQTFEWLGPLSALIVEVDELTIRDPAPTSAETAEMGTYVRRFTSSSDDPEAFGSRYLALLASEPRVAMSHVDLREALGGMREAAGGPGDILKPIERADSGPGRSGNDEGTT